MIKVLVATAELRPLVSAGGLAEAVAGLVAALPEHGIDVVTALPDYQGWPLDDETTVELTVPDWAAPATARIGTHPSAGRLALIDVPGIQRPDPYVDEDGVGWPDNMDRFAAFSVAVASLADTLNIDVVQLNDWHTALTPAFMSDHIPTVLTIHNLGYQGGASAEWLHRLPHGRDAYQWGDGINCLAGAIRLADEVVTVSPNYAAEIVDEAGGMGLHYPLAERERPLLGIRNGIDTRAWNPARDEHTAPFSKDDLEGKAEARAQLLDHVGWSETGEPLIVMVTRLVEQKGVDLAFEAARFLDGMRGRMIVLGSGERRLADWGRWLMDTQPERFWFFDGYDAPLSHLLFAGGDLLLMPSRFEPCGLAQMQAMAYGTLPIVTAVGGLVDTVIDADAHKEGNGFVASTLDESGVVDAIHRGLRAVRHAGRRRALQRRGMQTDWSWTTPAEDFAALYQRLAQVTE
jgi:starch synthase